MNRHFQVSWVYAINGSIYRAIATNRAGSAEEIIDGYNQRGEASENRIKELKLDFNAAHHAPHSDIKVNALYFGICTLAYNLFALMRHLAQEEFKMQRIKAIRWKV